MIRVIAPRPPTTPMVSFLSQLWFGRTEVADLRCGFLVAPRCIETAAPQLSRQLRSDERDVVQTAYRIQVASSAEKLAAGRPDLWESGRVESDASHLIVHAGRALTSREVAHWRVTVWTGAARFTRNNTPATWETGLLAPADWQARLIGGGDFARNHDLLVAQWCWEAVYHPTEDDGDEREHALDDRGAQRTAGAHRASIVSHGATTLWENMSCFDPVTKSTGKSFSRTFHCGFDHWFYEAVAGLRRDKPPAPAFDKVLSGPELVGLLDLPRLPSRRPTGLQQARGGSTPIISRGRYGFPRTSAPRSISRRMQPTSKRAAPP